MGQIRTAPTHCHGKAPAAYRLFDLLSAGTQHGIKGVLQVTQPLNALQYGALKRGKSYKVSKAGLGRGG